MLFIQRWGKANGRLIYVVLCLAIAAFFIYFRPPAETHDIKIPLSQAFSMVGGWKTIGDASMQQDIVDALELDDYLFRSYTNDQRVVSLYIGYYRSAAKVGAAHSPLVCFPGQGWEISVPQKVNFRQEEETVNLEKLLVRKGQQRELLLYWFQSYDMTSSGTFWQKVQNFWARLNSNPADNAFVRVSVAIEGESVEAAYQTAIDFIGDFYPLFSWLHHIMMIYFLEFLFVLTIVLCLSTYAFYPLVVMLIGRLFPFRPLRAESTPAVSILIAAYNEERDIRQKLENTLELDYPNDKIEIIVGSDGSTDRTAQITIDFSERGVKLLDFKENRGKNSCPE